MLGRGERTAWWGPAVRGARTFVGLCVATALISAGCTGEETPPVDGDTPTDASEAASPATIPQPAMKGDLTLAPESERVDLEMPTFSDPTNITNPCSPSRSRSRSCYRDASTTNRSGPR